LIGTGAEYIVTQLSSRRFVQKANKKGTIEKVVPNKYITLKYDDGSKENLDIIPRLSKTKMNNFISLEMQTLKEGDKVSKGQPVAWSKNFSKNGMYCAGSNSVVAVMQYDGLGHEDAYCVTNKFASKMTRDILREVSIIIPPETKLINLNQEIGKQITQDEVLVEFAYDYGIDTYLDTYDLDDLELDDESTNESKIQGNNNSIKLLGKNGEIVDIKIFINSKRNIDKQIVKIHSDMAKDTMNTLGKLAESYKNKDDQIKASDNIPLKFTKIGGHKLKGGMEFEGARIVYHIKQEIPLMTGDKIANRSGAKGVISRVLSEEDTPYAQNTEKKIEVFLSPTTVFSRKNLTILKELYLGKIIKHLDDTIKEMAKDEKIKTNDISKLVYDIYNILGSNDTKKALDHFLKKMTDTQFRKKLKEKDFQLFFPVPPFSKVEFSQIRSAAQFLDLELDEYVWLPEMERYTKNKVPVGYCTITALEQSAEIYLNARSTAGYQNLTGQATKGKGREGGQSVGQLDLNAFLTLDCPDIVGELYSLRSDDHQTKRSVVNTIINNGQSNLPKTARAGSGDTTEMLTIFMHSMGLFPN